MNKFLALSSLAVALAVAAPAHAAKISLLNIDPAGSGLNDLTVVAPSGANPGKTVGEQRRIVYQFAMDLWGGVVQSNVEIKIYASFANLTCTPTSGTLGQAGTNWIVWNTPGAVPNTYYPSALADALANSDLVPDPTDPGDIFSQFNAALGTPACLTTSQWYYGIDGNTPAGAINFLDVVMHEIGHGLGMAGYLNKTTGALPNFGGGVMPDIYTRYAYDNVSAKRFDDPAMTDSLRATTMKTPGRLVWDGPRVNAQAPLLLDMRRVLSVTAPAGAAGNYELGYGTFGPAATATTMPANSMVLVNDGVASASVNDGCETPFVNAAAVAGKYAIIDRGTCGFAVKVKNAQLNGAVGVIIANNAAGVIDLGGTDPTITIPSVMVSQADGNTLKANLPATGGVATVPGYLQGADNSGRVRLYAPTVVAGGSTFSHFDTALQPNAVMEPAITDTLNADVLLDLTPAAMADIGWTLQTGNTRLGTCDTTVTGVRTAGLIPGANVLGQAGVCKAIWGSNKASYAKCVMDRSYPLQQMGLISYLQRDKIFKCAALQP